MATIQGQLNTPRDSTFQTTESTSRNLADVLADELSGIAQAIADGGSTDYDDLSHRPQINSVTLTGDKSADDLSLAMQEDLTSIKATGTTNATGSTIASGTFFYLNGTLCKAKSDIANGATFTLNTNYEVVTAGGLNSLNSAIAGKQAKRTLLWTNPSPTATFAQQNISCDTTGYDALIMHYTGGSAEIQINMSGVTSYGYMYIFGTSSSIYHVWNRYFYRASANTVSVSNCTKVKIVDGTASVDNNSTIPLELYGIKF